MSGGTFDDLAEVFESIIDWPKRLANEEPFYRRLFARAGIKSVVDVACGTGHHAAMFHSWGLRVQGADLSPNMITHARRHHGEPAGLTWAIRGYDQPMGSEPQFDAAICVGNSLALAPNVETVHAALRQMLAGVRPGGCVMMHVMNIWALADGPCVWQKTIRTRLTDQDTLIIKGVHRSGARGYVDLLVCTLADTKLRAECVPLLGLEAGDLEGVMREAGASRVEAFGGYQEQPYDRGTSVDLVMVARK